MGGAILELEVEKILNRGKEEGIILTLAALVRDGILDLAEGAKRANMTKKSPALISLALITVKWYNIYIKQGERTGISGGGSE